MLQSLRSVPRRGSIKGSGSEVAEKTIRITVSPADNFFSKGSSAWNGELASLQTEIRRDLATSVAPVPPDGSKGDPLTIIALIISSGALTTLFQCIKLWIRQHPGRRKLDLTWNDGKTERTLRVDAENVDDASLKASVEEAIKRGR